MTTLLNDTSAPKIFLVLCSIICSTQSQLSFAQETQEGKTLKALYSSAQSGIELGQLNANIAAKAVQFASLSQGGMSLVTTGTLTQYAPSLDAFTYTAESSKI